MTLEVSINCIVVSDIPNLRVTTVTTTKVIVNNVKDFVTNKEFNFLSAKHLDKAAVVVETKTVSSSSGAPIVSVYKLHTSGEIAEERVTEQKTNTSSNQPLSGFVINLRIGRTDQIFKLLTAGALTLLRLRRSTGNNITHKNLLT